jgi:hypothetical protein
MSSNKMDPKSFLTSYLNDFSKLVKPDKNIVHKLVEVANLLKDIHADGKKTPRGYFFKEFLNHRLLKDGQMDQANLLQCDYLTDVDYIARFENFEEEVKYIFNSC